MNMRATPLACLALTASLLMSCATAPRFTPPQMKSYEVSLAANGDALVLSWYASIEGQRDAIYLRNATTAGKPQGPLVRLSDGQRHAYEPSLQLIDGDAVSAWYEKDDEGRLRALIGRFSPAGEQRWLQVLSSPQQDGRIPVVRVQQQRVHVAWLEQAAPRQPATLHYARLDASGRFTQSPRAIGSAAPDTWNLNAAVDASGRFLLVFDAHAEGASPELQLLEVGDDATRHITLSAADGHASTYPDLALQGERVALTWFDNRDGNEEVYLFAGSLADLTGPIDARATRITHSAGASIGAYTAWNQNRIGLTWCDVIDGEQRVYFQTFDTQARPLQPAQALTDGRLQGLIPAIMPWQDGFAVAWNERKADPDAHGHGATLSSFATLRTGLGRDSR